jgi:hypothetical protein
MADPTQFRQLLWAANTGVGIFLLVVLEVRKNYRVYPAFTFYIVMNLTQAALLYATYRRWGFYSVALWRVGWGTQAVVVCARALAVAEVCRHLLGRYPGIWALARRILLACAALVLLYSGLAARHQWKLALVSADRGLELAIAAVIVVLFLFTHYYEVEANPADRLLALGFCLYSCLWVVDNTILERYLNGYAALWVHLQMLAFLASLILWTWALRKSQTETAAQEHLLPLGVYQSVAPQINLRLRSLNDQLYKIWKPEVPRH